MSKRKVTILVACHKPDTVYEDEVYKPIHVGRAISTYKEEMCDMIGDDTGDNISTKNRSYCELTAQYWAWKNLQCDYIGFCHYRRYFKTKITCNNIEQTLDGYDMVVVKRVYLGHNYITWLKRDTVAEDAYILYKTLINMYPDYEKTIDKRFKYVNYTHPCNMMICKKQLFDDFAEWQFDILDKVEKLVKPSGYSRLRRNMGYFGEALLNIYIYINNLRIKEMPIVNMIGDDNILMSQSLSTKLRFKLHYLLSNNNYNWNYAMLAGLKADGIYQRLNKE